MQSVYLPQQHRAGMVYSCGLRRCLIIFAPHTHILDRRTCTCRTPSLQLILQRSKNFTSGVAVSFTPRSPIVHDRHRPPVTQVGHTTKVECLCPAVNCAMFPGIGAKTHTTSWPYPVNALRFHGLTSSRDGCFGHTEFSTVSKAVDSDGGLRALPDTEGLTPRGVNTQALGVNPHQSPLKETSEQEPFAPP